MQVFVTTDLRAIGATTSLLFVHVSDLRHHSRHPFWHSHFMKMQTSWWFCPSVSNSRCPSASSLPLVPAPDTSAAWLQELRPNLFCTGKGCISSARATRFDFGLSRLCNLAATASHLPQLPARPVHQHFSPAPHVCRYRNTPAALRQYHSCPVLCPAHSSTVQLGPRYVTHAQEQNL